MTFICPGVHGVNIGYKIIFVYYSGKITIRADTGVGQLWWLFINEISNGKGKNEI